MRDDEVKLATLAGRVADSAVDIKDVGFAFVVVVGANGVGRLELSMSARLSSTLTPEAELLFWEFAKRLDLAVKVAGEQVLSRGGQSQVVRDVQNPPMAYAPKAKA